MLGKYGVDSIVDYTTCFTIYVDDDDVLYDEVRMKSSFSVAIEDNFLTIKLLKQKLLTSLRGDDGLKMHEKTQPLKNKMELTDHEYRKFLSNVGFAMNKIKGWLNAVVFGDVIGLPFAVDQIATDVLF